MEGIGRALGNTFGGHWWGIGGHWRALVMKRNKIDHSVAYDELSAKHRKPNANLNKVDFHRKKKPSNIFLKIRGI